MDRAENKVSKAREAEAKAINKYNNALTGQKATTEELVPLVEDIEEAQTKYNEALARQVQLHMKT